MIDIKEGNGFAGQPFGGCPAEESETTAMELGAAALQRGKIFVYFKFQYSTGLQGMEPTLQMFSGESFKFIFYRLITGEMEMFLQGIIAAAVAEDTAAVTSGKLHNVFKEFFNS